MNSKIVENKTLNGSITSRQSMLGKIDNAFYNGLSAYELAVKYEGYEGTLEEWLRTLKGEQGEPFRYEDFTPEQLALLKGEPFRFEDFTLEQLESLKIKGDKGDAFRYEDFTEEQLSRLKGEKGDKFTFADFTEEELASLKGEPGEVDYSEIYKKDEVDVLLESAGKVKTVNGTEPDENGNIEIDVEHPIIRPKDCLGDGIVVDGVYLRVTDYMDSINEASKDTAYSLTICITPNCAKTSGLLFDLSKCTNLNIRYANTTFDEGDTYDDYLASGSRLKKVFAINGDATLLSVSNFVKTSSILVNIVAYGWITFKYDSNGEYISATDPLFLATQKDIPTLTSQLTNDSGFLTEHQDISHLATEEYVDTIAAIETVTDAEYNAIFGGDD